MIVEGPFDSSAAGTDWRAVAARLSSTSVIGFAAGAIIGGVGGRLAMLLLRLTSDPSLRGLETDDGFTIGVVTDATMFLVMLTAIFGILGALAYLAIRPWVPGRARPWVSAVVGGSIGGAAVIRPEGIDFTLLEPLWLAVAMFVTLPSAYGLALSILVERSFRRPARGGWTSLLGLALLVPVIPLPLTLGSEPSWIVGSIAVVIALWLAARGRGFASVWTSLPVVWLGRTGLAASTTVAGVVLVHDVVAIL